MDGPFPEYGTVSPSIPSTATETNATSHAFPENLRCHLPNIVGLRRAYCSMMNTVNNTPRTWDHNLGDAPAATAAVAVAHNAANNQARDARIMPGTLYPHNLTTAQLRLWTANASRIVVPNVAPGAGDTSLLDMMGLDRTNWFGQVAALISQYCRHWNGSTTLDKISVRNGSSALITCTSTAVYATANAHRAAAINTMDFHCTAISLTDILNWTPAVNFSPLAPADIFVATHHGPYWNLAPERYQTIEYDPTTSIPALLVQPYHVEKP